MARARIIKPGFFKNENLTECSFPARLLFAGLWTLADRAGRLEDRPKKIKMEIFPSDDVDCNELLNELCAHGFIKRYQIDEAKYIQILTFSAHQKPHQNEKESTIPPEGFVPKPEALATMAPSPSDQGDNHSGLNLDPLTLNPNPLPVVVYTHTEVGKQISKITGWDSDPNWSGDYGRIEQWLANGWDAEKDIIPTVRKLMGKRSGPPGNLKYFEQAIADAHASRLKPLPEGKIHESTSGNYNGSNGKSRKVREVIADEHAKAYGRADGGNVGRIALPKL